MVEGTRSVGIAYADTTGRLLGACEFLEPDDHLSLLEAVVSQLGPKEVVLPKELPAVPEADVRRLQDLLTRCGALASEKPKALFATKNLEGDLGRLLRAGATALEQHRTTILDKALAAGALAAVTAFLELTTDPAHLGKFSLQLYDLKRYMRIDIEAQRALNVFKAKGEVSDSFSLYGLLNRCRTAMGKRLLRTWLKQPLIDPVEINRRLDVVAAFANDPGLRDQVRGTLLRGLPDVDRLTRKLERRKATLADLCQLYRASARLPAIEAALRGHDGPTSEVVVDWFGARLAAAHDAEHLGKYEELLEAAVDLERVPEEYLICAAYSKDLQAVAEEKGAAEAEVQAAAERAAKDLGLQLDKTLKLEWLKVSNTRTRCLRITQKEELAVRNKLQGGKYSILEAKKDGTKFTSKDLRAAAERLQKHSGEYETLQKGLVEQVVGVAHTFVEVWESVAQLLAELDVLASFGDLSASARTPFVRPTILPADEGKLVLEACRHPCVEAQDGVEFIANDCRLVKGQSWFQIITGPNMGGKSTYIRQVGVTVLMAQIGCFVPCDVAEIAVRDAIFARVGAGDCQLRGVSTFMAEMLETAAILKGAGPHSLAIIDELGRGTSTYDGFGLAWAIAERLMELGCPTLFATHFHELTDIQGDVGVANRHVESMLVKDTGRLTMLYRVADGACDQSFGIHVAEFCNFPASTVELAKRKAEELEATVMRVARPQEEGEGAARPAKRPTLEAAWSSRGRALLEARGFMQKFRALPLTELGPGEALARTRELLKEMEEKAKDNACLAEILETGSAL